MPLCALVEKVLKDMSSKYARKLDTLEEIRQTYFIDSYDEKFLDNRCLKSLFLVLTNGDRFQTL